MVRSTLPQLNASDAPPDWASFSHPEGLFSLRYPVDWEQIPPPGAEACFAVAADAYTFLEIYALQPRTEENLVHRYTSVNLEFLKEEHADLRVIRQEEISVRNASTCVRLIVEYRDQDFMTTTDYFVMGSESMILSVNLKMISSLYENVVPVFEQVAGSVKAADLLAIDTLQPDRWESIGVLFDIDQLGETEEQRRSYGHQALLIFMRHLDPCAVGRAVLWHGDTDATLRGGEQRYAIAVTPENPAALTLIREAFSRVEDKGLAPLSQRFCKHPVDLDFSSGSPRAISREPLPLGFSLDEDGTCVITKLNGEDVALCRKFGWRFKLPDKVQAVVAEIHEGKISPESAGMIEEMECVFQAIDLEISGVPRILLEYVKYFEQQCEQITTSSPPSSLILQFPFMIALGRLGDLMFWSREEILARVDRDEVLSAIQYLGVLSFSRESYEAASECFQRLEECAQENSPQKLDALAWRQRCLARVKKPEAESRAPQVQAIQIDDTVVKHVNEEVADGRRIEAVQDLECEETVCPTEPTRS